MFASVAECSRAYVSWPRALAALACTSRALRTLLADDVRALAELIRLCSTYDRMVVLTFETVDSCAADNGAPRCVLRRAMFAQLALRLPCTTPHVDFRPRFTRYARRNIALSKRCEKLTALREMIAVAFVGLPASDIIVFSAGNGRCAEDELYVDIARLDYGVDHRTSWRLNVFPPNPWETPESLIRQCGRGASKVIFVNEIGLFRDLAPSEYDVATRWQTPHDDELFRQWEECSLYKFQRDRRYEFNYFDDNTSHTSLEPRLDSPNEVTK